MAKKKSQSGQNGSKEETGTKFNSGATKLINPDKEILEKDRVYCEIHNLDGRLHGRIYDTIVNIRTVASTGERIYFTPSLQKTMDNDNNDFMVLVLRFRGDREVEDRERQPALHSKNWEEGRRNHIDPQDEKFYEVSFLIFKYDLYIVGFRNKDKWRVIQGFSQHCKYKYQIANAEDLRFGCRYGIDFLEKVHFGPGVLIDDIKALYGQSREDRDKWEKSFFDIVVHFIEAARFLIIQNDVMEAFKVEIRGSLIKEKKKLDQNHQELIKSWTQISEAYEKCFNDGHWDRGLMEGKGVPCVDSCEEILGIVKCDDKKQEKMEQQVGRATSSAIVNLTDADKRRKEKGKAIIRE